MFVCTRRESSQRISLVIIVLPVTALIALRVHRGRNTDLPVSFRQHRYGKYSFGRGCSILGLVLFIVFAARRIAAASPLAAPVALAMGTLVTTRRKASVHAGVTAVCAAVLFFVSLPLAVLAGLAVLALAWARIFLRQHTPTQVALGWAIALVSVAVVFPLFLPLPPT